LYCAIGPGVFAAAVLADLAAGRAASVALDGRLGATMP
jgi:hypothetical protein